MGGCSGNGNCNSNGKCECNPGFMGENCGTKTAESSCAKHCNPKRGTCSKRINPETKLEEEYCHCKVGSMWINGGDKDRCDTEQCPKQCGMGADGVANGVCVDGVANATLVLAALTARTSAPIGAVGTGVVCRIE